jgi:hypothetical protein
VNDLHDGSWFKSTTPQFRQRCVRHVRLLILRYRQNTWKISLRILLLVTTSLVPLCNVGISLYIFLIRKTSYLVDPHRFNFNQSRHNLAIGVHNRDWFEGITEHLIMSETALVKNHLDTKQLLVETLL